MSALPKYVPHYTLAEYSQWQGEWELWQGVPVAMSPSPFGRHQWVAGEIAYQLNHSLRDQCKDCFVLTETDWIVSEDTIVRPDVVIVCGPFPERHILAPPRLIVEVLSPATEEKDRNAKKDLYAMQAVDFYLLVDPIGKKVEAFQLESVTGKYVRRSIQDRMAFELSETCVAQLELLALFRI